VTLIDDVPDVLSDGGVKLAFAPGGSPLTLKTMLLENPFITAIVAVKLAPPPELTVRD
jgi:hypothetical protein